MCGYQFCEKIWFNGKFCDLTKPLFDLRASPIHYGIGAMDSVRGYATQEGINLFRLKDHVKRLHISASAYHLTVPFEASDLEKTVVEIVKVNKITSDCYVQLQVNPGNLPKIGSIHALEAKVDVAMLATLDPTILESERFEEDRRAIVSSWRAIPHDVLPLTAKANGNFASYYLAGIEAKKQGADVSILLDHCGLVCEASMANIFIVKDGALITPASNAPILAGITRETIIRLAGDLNLQVLETIFPRSMLYSADEIFICGTGTEITPITQIDYAKVSRGPGPITRRIAGYFKEVVRGQLPKYKNWLTTVR